MPVDRLRRLDVVGNAGRQHVADEEGVGLALPRRQHGERFGHVRQRAVSEDEAFAHGARQRDHLLAQPRNDKGRLVAGAWRGVVLLDEVAHVGQGFAAGHAHPRLHRRVADADAEVETAARNLVDEGGGVGVVGRLAQDADGAGRLVPAQHPVARRLSAVARAEHGLRDLHHDQLVLAELFARDLEEQPRPDPVHLEHADARLRLRRDDTSVRQWARLGVRAATLAASAAATASTLRRADGIGVRGRGSLRGSGRRGRRGGRRRLRARADQEQGQSGPRRERSHRCRMEMRVVRPRGAAPASRRTTRRRGSRVRVAAILCTGGRPVKTESPRDAHDEGRPAAPANP